ncbi:MAG: hypothetical protein ACN4GR_16285 [Arenicellales bacterium]
MLERSEIKEAVMLTLQRHQGKANTITMIELTAAVMDFFIIPNEKYNQSRAVRSVIRQLRFEGVPIGHCNSGYFLAKDQKELDETADLIQRRAVSSLQLVRELRRINVGELLQQLEIELNNEEGEV